MKATEVLTGFVPCRNALKPKRYGSGVEGVYAELYGMNVVGAFSEINSGIHIYVSVMSFGEAENCLGAG